VVVATMTLHQKTRWLWTESGGNDNTPSKKPGWYSLGVVATMATMTPQQKNPLAIDWEWW
jgi:hypothetical protein